jgi:alpha-tubulin suppressor-like RCC1 family protein
LNGGTCTLEETPYHCDCINNWKGDNCDICGSGDTEPETCDLVDNDCNGLTDETFDLAGDPENCGGCGNSCALHGSLWPDSGNQVPANVADFGCESSQCVIDACQGGYGDDKVSVVRDCDVTVLQMAVGTLHTCALVSNNRVYCWGRNNRGQLGADTLEQDYSTSPLPVMNLTGVEAIAADSNHTCALLDDGTVKCWGYNDWYQLGKNLGELDSSVVPLEVEGLSNVIGVGAGLAFSCALLGDGTVQCWGRNNYGQLGYDTGEDGYSIAPQLASSISGARALYLGSYHACVILAADDSIDCWGRAGHGQLGEDVGASSMTPVHHSFSSGVETLGMGGHHTCAHLEDGSAYCWGWNSNGQVGVDPLVEGTDVYSPTLVGGLSGVIGFGLGTYHSCAVLNNGQVNCFGENGYGRLGTVHSGDSYTPLLVDLITSAVSGDAGYWHTCVNLSDDVPHCWGRNHWGQLGNGEFEVNTNEEAQAVVGLL